MGVDDDELPTSLANDNTSEFAQDPEGLVQITPIALNCHGVLHRNSAAMH